MKRPTTEVAFAHGFATACVDLVRLHDQPGMAADVIAGAGFQLSDFAGLDPDDLEVLRKLFHEERSLRKLKGRLG